MLNTIRQFIAWVKAGKCLIVDKRGKQIPLQFNKAQTLIIKAMYQQAQAHQPVRVVVGKSRQQGSTTLAMCFAAFCVWKRDRINAFSLSHRWDELAAKFREVPTSIMSDMRVPLESKTKTELYLKNRSAYRIGASKSDFVLSGNTCQVLHIMEGSKFEGTQGEENVISVLGSVPYEPDTCIIFESTAYGGRDPIHFARLDAALNQDDYPYRGVFLPWFLQDEYSIQTNPLIRTDEEHQMVEIAATYGITLRDEQLAWRRGKALEYGTEYVNREYPNTYLQAVESAEGLIYPGLDLCIIDELPDQEWDRTMMYGGYDAGTEPDPCAILNAFYHRDHLYIYDSYQGQNIPLDQQAQVLVEGTTYFCDPSAKREMFELNRYCNNVSLMKAPRRKVPGDNDFVTEEIRLVQNIIRKGKLHIVKSCAHRLIEEAGSYFWNKSGKPITKRIDGHHFDNLSALKYLVMGVERQNVGTGTLVPSGVQNVYHKRMNRETDSSRGRYRRTRRVRAFV